MIPRTKNGLPAFACISAMQKCIRRGMEKEAMQFAVEMMHSSKAFCSMATKRLEVISHEDVDTQTQPHIAPFVKAACEQARSWWDADPAKCGKARMAVGNAIRMMCRATKSREGDHFQASIGWAEVLEHFTPEIPDWAYDQHTYEGRAKKRGLKFFREESTKLVPKPKKKDRYEDEAYRLWQLKADTPKSTAMPVASVGGLFDEDASQ